MKVVNGLHGAVYTSNGVTHWQLSDGRSGSDPQTTVLHSAHPLLSVDVLDVLPPSSTNK